LADLVLTKDWGDVRLVGAFGYVRHNLTEQFDATRNHGDPRVFRQASRINLFSAETRLSGGRSDGFNWVAGASLIKNRMDQERDLGPVLGPVALPGTANDIVELSLFGEGSVETVEDLWLTLGGRATYSHRAGEGLGDGAAIASGFGTVAGSRKETVFLPSGAIQWNAARDLSLFARYQESYRPGGLSAVLDRVRQFRSDHVASLEGGFRWSSDEPVLALAGSVVFTRWTDIQADLITLDGFPATANIGGGRIVSAVLSASWRPVRAFSLEANLVLNHSELTQPDANSSIDVGYPLPNVADVSGRIGGDYRIELGGGQAVHANGSLRYYGDSTLGTGAMFRFDQGDLLDASAGFRWENGPHSVSLDVTNLLDQAGNRFSLGSPTTLFLNPQVTPMRPRSARVGYQIRF
jgi:outer membrane receptor protein involved in Fe transport